LFFYLVNFKTPLQIVGEFFLLNQSVLIVQHQNLLIFCPTVNSAIGFNANFHFLGRCCGVWSK
jgi:hypothetical protein